jgi:regulatory protein
LDLESLNAMALAYVARYATSCARLRAYLLRKLRERGWHDEGNVPPVEALVERIASLGYVDDAAYAAGRGAALRRRGLGERRIGQALRAAGVEQEAGAPQTEEQQLEAALVMARRRRIGPFASGERDREQRRRDVAMLLRAGHGVETARRVAAMRPGEGPEEL